MWVFFFQAEDGIRDLVRSRGLGDVYKRQGQVAVGIEGVFRLVEQRVTHQRAPTVAVIPEHGLSLIHI